MRLSFRFRAGDDARARAAATHGEEVPRRKKLAVWVGRLDADKSPLLFVRACALVAADDPQSECLIVGDGPLQPANAAAQTSGFEFLRSVLSHTSRSDHSGCPLETLRALRD